ncbi:hypothetical protein [Chryseobacterium sp.]|uniref:hypothetical protein n=1 Tax=Chryseobacterium sp. TaxID=1871047 RepID=UPI0035B493DA
MKKIIIHSVPVVSSLMWLWTTCQTFNPVVLKGPDFLKFYILLILGFYASVFMLNSFKEKISEVTLYFTGFIFLLGIIKLIRGIVLEKPVGFLVMILIAECIVTVIFMSGYFNKKIK